MGKKEQGSPSLPRGVTIREGKHGSSIVLTFTYKGVLCREPLPTTEVNAKTIKYAERLLGEVKNKISLNQFVYVDYFPKSKKLGMFGCINPTKTASTYMTEYLEICKKRNLSPSTIEGYEKWVVTQS